MLSGEFLFKRYGATLEDYNRAADEDTRLELLDGVLIMHSPANVRHERQFGFLLALLDGFAIRTGSGIVLGSRTPMVLDDERHFEPDLLFVKTGHLHRLGEVALTGPADLVIEILSPATRDYDLGEKREAYAAGGVPEYWMIDARVKRFLVDRPAGTRVAELSHERYETEAIPGFWLNVGWLWQEPLPDAGTCLGQIR
jgi:Uma2 family endonuclease